MLSFSLDRLTWSFFLDAVLLPCAALALGIALGAAASRRLQTVLASGRIPADSLPGIFLRSLGRLPQLWGLQLGLYWLVYAASAPAFVQRAASCLIFTLFAYSAATVLQRSLSQLITLRAASSDSPVSTSLLTNLASAVVYFLAAVIVLDFYGISITPILTALGVGGMAVALGLQETMANIFAGLHLLLSKQVRIGDHIRLDSGAEGQIADITWRYAKIHTSTNNVIIIPNNKLAAAVITNYDMPITGGASVEDVAFTVAAGVAYESDLERVERVTLEVAREVLARLDPALDTDAEAPTAPAVRFHTFGDSSIDFNVVLHTTVFRRQSLIRHEFIKALKKRYDAEGIDIPFPIRVVYTEKGAP